MRYVTAKKTHQCIVCKSIIGEDEVCIQSQGIGHWFYHEDCHEERFGNSPNHRPTNERPEEDKNDKARNEV